MDSVHIQTKVTSSSPSFNHYLLQLMPYRADVSRRFLKLQNAVNDVLDQSRSEDERIASAKDFSQRIDKLEIPDQHQLTAEVIQRVAEEIPSLVMSEQVALAYMRRDGIQVLYENSLPPRLEWDPPQKGRVAASASVTHYMDASYVWRDAITDLLALSPTELGEFSEASASAAIRMLQLHMLYGSLTVSVTTPDERIRFMEGAGLSLWNALLQALKRHSNMASIWDVLGRPAQHNVWHQLNGQVQHKILDAPAGHLAASTARPNLMPGQHLVILDPIQPSNDREDQSALQRYEALRQPVPIRGLPGTDELHAIEVTLLAEFPWATQAIGDMISELRTRRLFGATELGLTPTLLVGAAGCGKTRLVRRFAEEFKVPLTSLSLAGMSDAMALQGTARGWATGQPSPLITGMLAHLTASGIVQLDEIDKSIHQTSKSPPVTSALLHFLEPENSKRYHDHFLQATCDLSKLIFIATANTLSTLPRPLLSRFRIVRVPPPHAEHFGSIARSAARDLFREWGLPPESLPQLNFHEQPAGSMSAREIREFVRRALADWAKENLGAGRTH